MIELFDTNQFLVNRKSSKGNQLKWEKEGIWYKADNMGYEGLIEMVVSKLLQKSTLSKDEYVLYETEKIKYKKQLFNGCSSKNFLPKGWQLITLERLFENFSGIGLNKAIYQIRGEEERIRFLVEHVERITGLTDFGIYMSKILTIDAFFLNEDRHSHNLAVLLDENSNYHLCPIFDNGAGLLSDINIDYPLGDDLIEMIDEVKSKTICENFDIQLDAVEKLYGQHLKFKFTKKDVEEILRNEDNYSDEIKERVKEIIFLRMNKYQYMF